MLDPEIKAMLALLASAGSQPLAVGGVAAARAQFELATVGIRRPETLAQVASTDDLVLPHGRAGRIYRPDLTRPVPTILFFHGGGFVLGSIETHDDQARLLCRDVGAVVVSVEYALAPEEPFPAGLQDCLAATRWASAHLSELGGEDRLVVAGDSAGGNFAAAVSIACRDNGPTLAAQLLIYPNVDFAEDSDYPSRLDNAEGYFLTAADMIWFSEQLAADPADPRASVLRADLTGLPPTVITTAEYDPLRDEGEAYGKALGAAGVPVTVRRADGMIHGFFGLGTLSTGAAAATRQVCDDLRAVLLAT